MIGYSVSFAYYHIPPDEMNHMYIYGWVLINVKINTVPSEKKNSFTPNNPE